MKDKSMLAFMRVLTYVVGIFLFAMGVVFAIKSDLGVSPVSTLPYVVSLLTGYTVGMMTALLYVLFVGLQWLLLGKGFRKVDGLQLVFAFGFGFCVDLSKFLIRTLTYRSLLGQVVYLCIGTVMIGFGIFLILKTGLIVSPTDGLVKAIAQRFNQAFSGVKIGVDLSVSILSAVLSYVFLGSIVGVGFGTVFSAFSVGFSIRFFEHIIGDLFEEKALEEVDDVA